MSALRVVFLVALASALVSPVLAQPKGPRDVITGARQQQAQREMRQAAGTGEAATADAKPPSVAQPPAGAEDAPPADPHAGVPGAPAAGARDPHAAAAPTSQPAAQRPLSESRVDTSLPMGTIRVRVLDGQERPVVGQKVRIGIMAGDGKREALHADTGADGYASFAGLPAGANRAYRASLEYEGAKYGANPFRLPPRGGQEVVIRRLPVTRDSRMVVLYVGATSLELKDERIKVVQQARLLNIGRETYVFPEDGTHIVLPEGFLAFQAQESMTDQKVEAVEGKGMAFKGSVPPGETTLLWGFDLPLEGTEADFAIDLPWLTFAYRVVADAPKGLTLAVDEMPEPQLHAEGGRRFLVTSIQRRVGEEPFKRLRIKLQGIPGPGPGRWIAAALALLAVVGGFVFAGRAPAEQHDHDDAVGDLAARKDALLQRAATLRSERDRGDVGPKYYADERAKLEQALAELLYEADKLGA